MDTSDIRRLVQAAERAANALERIASACEEHNAADPIQIIQEALTISVNKPVNVDDQLPSAEEAAAATADANLRAFPNVEDWRRR